MNKTVLKDKFTKFTDLQDKRDIAFFAYFRNISTLSVGLIGLLIGLKPQMLPNLYSKYLFLITIILIGLCILFSLGVQFYEIVTYRHYVSAQRKQIIDYIDSPSENIFQASSFDKPKIYKFFELSTFSCLILSILALIAYVYALEF